MDNHLDFGKMETYFQTKIQLLLKTSESNIDIQKPLNLKS